MLEDEHAGAFLSRQVTVAGTRLVPRLTPRRGSRQGCYMQLLAGRYGAAAVHMLRVGEPVDAARYASQRALAGRNNVQQHAEWSLRLPEVLQAVRRLSGLEARDTAQGAAAHGAAPGAKGRCVALPSLSASSAGAGGVAGGWPASWLGDARDNRSAYRRPALFSLRFCGEGWWAPRCEQQAARGGWEPCDAAAQCERWRWCVREAAQPTPTGDRFEECTPRT